MLGNSEFFEKIKDKNLKTSDEQLLLFKIVKEYLIVK